MKKLRAAVVLVAIATTVSAGQALNAEAHVQKAGPCTGWHGHRGGDKSDARYLIRCATDRWSVAGGASHAISTAECESGLREHAYNASGCGGSGCSGFFQQHVGYWYGRAKRYLQARWFGGRKHFPPGPARGRANVIVSIRMAHADGWGDWPYCGR